MPSTLYFFATFPASFEPACSMVVFPLNPLINSILIKPPDPSNPDRRDPALGGVLADCDSMELEILGEFLSGHDLWHLVGLQL